MPQFDWRNYVTIRDADPLNRAKFEVMLDRIASTEDGKNLIQRAHEISGPIEVGSDFSQMTLDGSQIADRLTLVDTRHEGKSFGGDGPNGVYAKGGAVVLRGVDGNYTGKVILNPANPGTMKWMNDDGTVHVSSQTSTLVHELYHLADPNHLPHVKLENGRRAVREELEAYIQTPDLTEAQRKEFLDALVNEGMEKAGLTNSAIRENPVIIDDEMNYESVLGNIMFGLESNPRYLANFNFPHSDTRVEVRSYDEAQDLLLKSNKGFKAYKGSVAGEDEYRLSPDMAELQGSTHAKSRASRLEEQATDYTDAFMYKNFGEKNLRRGYSNGVSIDTGQAPEEPLPLQSPLTGGPKYQPDTYSHPGNLPSPPTIAPITPSQQEQASENRGASR